MVIRLDSRFNSQLRKYFFLSNIIRRSCIGTEFHNCISSSKFKNYQSGNWRIRESNWDYWVIGSDGARQKKWSYLSDFDAQIMQQFSWSIILYQDLLIEIHLMCVNLKTTLFMTRTFAFADFLMILVDSKENITVEKWQWISVFSRSLPFLSQQAAQLPDIYHASWEIGQKTFTGPPSAPSWRTIIMRTRLRNSVRKTYRIITWYL